MKEASLLKIQIEFFSTFHPNLATAILYSGHEGSGGFHKLEPP